MGMEDAQKIMLLEKDNNITELEEMVKEAEMLANGEVMRLAEEAIDRLKQRTETIVPPIEITREEVSIVEDLGGSQDDLQKVAHPIDEEIIVTDEKIQDIIQEATDTIIAIGGTHEETGSVKDLESFTVPFGKYEHTIEIPDEESYIKAAEKLTALGYHWNGDRDLMTGIDNQFIHPPFKLIVEPNATIGTPGKQVTYILPGSGDNY